MVIKLFYQAQLQLWTALCPETKWKRSCVLSKVTEQVSLRVRGKKWAWTKIKMLGLLQRGLWMLQKAPEHPTEPTFLMKP